MERIKNVIIEFPGRPFDGNATDIVWQIQRDGTLTLSTEKLGPQESSRRLRELANYIDQRTEPFPSDTNTILARLLAAHLVPDPGLPKSVALMTPEQKADLVFVVDQEPLRQLPVSSDNYDPFTRIATLFGRIASMSENLISDLPNALGRISVILRMWAGCVDTGKALSPNTKSGPNEDRDDRVRRIEDIANGDPVYAAGIDASPVIKKRRNEPMSFEGVPEGTRVARLQDNATTAERASAR